MEKSCSQSISIENSRTELPISLFLDGIGTTNSESNLNLLPVWKQELMRKKRFNDGFASSVVGRKTAGASGIETGNPIEHRLHQHPKKGLVAALQTVYEPPAEVAATLEGKKPVRTQRLAATSLLGFEPGMLARPWQAGSTALHGSETAPSPPPPISKSPQLGAVAAGAAGIVHSSPDGLSSSQSRSVSGRSPGRFPDLAANTRPPHVTASGDKSRNGSHGAEPSHHLNRYQSSSKPRRRLSEPNRDSAVTSSTANAVAMVDETRSKHSSSKDAVDNRVKLSSKTLSSLKGIMGSRENYEDEELQYGPGIVNKLKSRYLSRTLRERAVESHRPSLRRAASLEDWLDKDSVPTGQQSRASKSTTAGDDGSSQVTVRGRSKGERPVSLNLAPQVEQQVPVKSPVVPVVVSKARDLKKTRSIDCVGQPAWRSASVTDLLVTSPTPQQQQQQQQQTPKSSTPTRSPTQPTTPTSPKTPVHLLLSKDAIVIVDKNASPEAKTAANKSSVSATSSSSTAVSSSSSVPSRGRRSLPNSRYNVEDPELPPPDTVRQVKRLFETSGSNRKVAVNNRRSQSAGPGFNRTPLSAANQTTDKSSLNVIRMNQTNLDNSKGVSSPSVVAANKKATDAYKLVSDSKPVVITKPSPIRPKPAVLSPKPVVVTVGDKTRVISSPAPFKTPAAVVVVTDLPVDKSEDEKDNDDDNGVGGERGFKIISKTALDNIHKESTTVKFNFDDSNKKEEKPVTDKSATSVQSRQVGVIRPQIKSPTILSDKPVIFDNNPPSPNTNNAARTVDVSVKKDEPVMKPLPPPPSLTNNKTTIDTRAIDVQKVTKENSSTLSAPAVETGVRPTSPAVVVPTATVSKPPPIVVVDKKEIKVIVSSSVHEKTANPTVVIAAASSPSSAAAAAAVREPKAKQWHQNQSETTTVFNFVNDNKNVDHIRNEGGSTGKLVYQANDSGITKLPDYDPGESSDFIDDLDILKRPPSPCNVDFEGANVVVGKSLIRRAAKKIKLNLTFNDDMTQLYEYPSEVSLLEEPEDAKLVTVKHIDQYSVDSSSPKLSPNIKGGGLSSYTPSKVHIESTFELGVSRSTALDSSMEQSAPSNAAVQVESALNYIKPAEEKTTWSAETTSDLLF